MRLALVLLLALILAMPVAAQESGLRFEIAPGAVGVTRVDTQTGAVSHCSANQGGWACDPVAAAAPAAATDRVPSGPPAALRPAAVRMLDRLVAVVGRLKHPRGARPATPAAS